MLQHDFSLTDCSPMQQLELLTYSTHLICHQIPAYYWDNVSFPPLPWISDTLIFETAQITIIIFFFIHVVTSCVWFVLWLKLVQQHQFWIDSHDILTWDYTISFGLGFMAPQTTGTSIFDMEISKVSVSNS